MRWTGPSAPFSELLGFQLHSFLVILDPKTEKACFFRINTNTILCDVSAINPHSQISFRQDIYQKHLAYRKKVCYYWGGNINSKPVAHLL